MSATLVLPEGYAYAGAAIVSTFWLTFWQMTRVGKARGTAGIPYPQMYAEKGECASSKDSQVFNCCQRAHQNTLEFQPAIVVSTAIAATKYPILAAALCANWVLARTVYTLGYSTGDPSKRNMFKSAMIGGMTTIALLTTATFTVAKHLLA